ncbi:hypothetical protein B1691_08645 [Geobacillus sp. 47C-IIb]|nr:hypothetical protein B1691_08645 [Geobacillus sp. 47C-IIb]
MEKGIAPLLAASAAMPPSPPIRFVPVHMARCTVQKQPKNGGGVHGDFSFVKRNMILIYQWVGWLTFLVSRTS